MPGRTTTQAFESFIAPLESALACIGSAKITVSPGGRSDSKAIHAWLLNRGAGMRLPGGLTFKAAMNYQFLRVDDLEGGPWRCTTLGYMYSIEDKDAREILAYHWHPSGASHFRAPHLHVGTVALAPSGVVTAGSHLPTGRVSFETFVRLVITDFGVPPRRSSWEKDLALTEGIFEVYRSWSMTPPELGPSRNA